MTLFETRRHGRPIRRLWQGRLDSPGLVFGLLVWCGGLLWVAHGRLQDEPLGVLAALVLGSIVVLPALFLRVLRDALE